MVSGSSSSSSSSSKAKARRDEEPGDKLEDYGDASEISRAVSTHSGGAAMGVLRHTGETAMDAVKRVGKAFKFFERQPDGKYKFKRPRLEHPGVFLEIGIYLAFLVVFSVVVYYMRDPEFTFHQNDMLRRLLLRSEIPGVKIYKSFADVATTDELWQWATGPLLSVLLTDQGSGSLSLFGTNYLVGLARMRQVRVTASQCHIPTAFRTLVPRCYPPYSSAVIERAAYGPNQMWEYQSGTKLGTNKQLARWNLYDGGGYTFDIGGRASWADELAAMTFLRNNSWIDLQTRAVFVDLTTYNPNVNLFTVMQVQFEFLPSGGVYPEYKFRVLRLLTINDTDGKAFLFVEILLVAFVFYFIGEEVAEITRDIWRHRRWLRRSRKVGDSESATALAGSVLKHTWTTYWRNGWNSFDLLNVGMFAFVFVARIFVNRKFAALDIKPFDRSRFFNFQEVVLWDALEKNVLACNAFMLWFKVFKYTSFSPRMSMIASVSSAAFKPMFLFVTLFMVVIFGFAQAGSLAFGADVEGYDTLGLTFLTMLLAALGEFDFRGLQHSNRVFGPIFFFAFVILVVFVILSMFLAIVDNTYDEVRNDIRRAKQPSFIERFFAWGSTTRAGGWLVAKLALEQQVNKLHKAIRRADRNEDGLLDKNELRDVISQSKGFFDGTVDEIFALYDKDQNDQLSETEAGVFMRDVALKHQRVAENLIALREAGGADFNTLFDLVSDRIDRSERRLIASFEAMIGAVDPGSASKLREMRHLPSLSTSNGASLFRTAVRMPVRVASTLERPHWAVSQAVTMAKARKRKLTMPAQVGAAASAAASSAVDTGAGSGVGVMRSDTGRGEATVPASGQDSPSGVRKRLTSALRGGDMTPSRDASVQQSSTRVAASGRSSPFSTMHGSG